MTDVNLSQSEADALIAMTKYRINEAQWDFPSLGGTASIPLRSEDKKEEFFLDISRGKIDLKWSWSGWTLEDPLTGTPTTPRWPPHICTYIGRDMAINGPHLYPVILSRMLLTGGRFFRIS